MGNENRERQRGRFPAVLRLAEQTLDFDATKELGWLNLVLVARLQHRIAFFLKRRFS
jgi:hypothetical protein